MAVRGKALLAPLWWSLCWSGAADEPRVPPAASPTAAELASEVVRVRGLCAPLWRYPSAECMAALDRIYLNRDVTLNYHSEALRDPAEGVKRPWGPKPLRDDLVWRHVFEDPLALRRMVEAAMADPQCLAMRGEVRHRLREVCAADAFARLSVLHFACGRILYWDGHELHDGWPAEWARERRHLKEDAQSPDDYAWRLATLNESELHFAWRLTKCRAVPRRAMERIVALQLPSHPSGASSCRTRVGSPAAAASPCAALGRLVAGVHGRVGSSLSGPCCGRAAGCGHASDELLPGRCRRTQDQRAYGRGLAVAPLFGATFR